MIPAARVSAAIEIFADIEARRRPASDALKDWGLTHRFAGSQDRAAIGSLVYDALRRRASAAWIMRSEEPRAILLGAMREARSMPALEIAALCSGQDHAPPPLSDYELRRLGSATLEDAPDHVRGDYPEWLAAAFAQAFGATAVEEGRALAARAPLDLRVNLLKSDRARAAKALDHLHPELTPLSPWGLRIPLGADGRSRSLQAEPPYARGHVEIQDEGSQITTLLTGAKPGDQVLDLCAGAGGKSLALAAMMQNKGQIYATDTDGRRLTPIYARLERADVRNLQVRAPRGSADVLAGLEARCDLVVIDAPCTGTGTWRRNPDAKWRTRPGALNERMKDQDEVLDQGSRFVKPGGHLAYITCSVLEEENEQRIAAFLARQGDFLPLEAAHWARKLGLDGLEPQVSRLGSGLRLSPYRTGTDGFFFAILARQ